MMTLLIPPGNWELPHVLGCKLPAALAEGHTVAVLMDDAVARLRAGIVLPLDGSQDLQRAKMGQKVGFG